MLGIPSPPADPAPTPSPEPFFDGILNLLGKCRNVYDIVTVWDTEVLTQLFFILIYKQCSFVIFVYFINNLNSLTGVALIYDGTLLLFLWMLASEKVPGRDSNQ
jgi:hypothetical protein